jgi:hypothetical protein
MGTLVADDGKPGALSELLGVLQTHNWNEDAPEVKAAHAKYMAEWAEAIGATRGHVEQP